MAQTAYFVRLRGKTYSGGGPLNVSFTIQGAAEDPIGVFVGPNAPQAQGAFAIIRARCELPTVNVDAEMHLFGLVLKELDNVGA